MIAAISPFTAVAASGTRSRGECPAVGRAGLFDDLVRAQQHRLRDRQPERLRGLKVDHQLKSCGPRNGKLRVMESGVRDHRADPEVNRGSFAVTQILAFARPLSR